MVSDNMSEAQCTEINKSRSSFSKDIQISIVIYAKNYYRDSEGTLTIMEKKRGAGQFYWGLQDVRKV